MKIDAGRKLQLAMLLAGVVAVVLSGGASMLSAAVWVPVIAPAVMLLTAGGLVVAESRLRTDTRPAAFWDLPAHRAASGGQPPVTDDGDIERAWQNIRDLPADRSTIDLLCDFGDTLESSGYLDLAAEVFHRAAQVDVRHRNVGRRLIAVSRSCDDRDSIANDDDYGMPASLSRYQILEPMGRGSNGTVYLATDPAINRLVALKVLNLHAGYGDEEVDEGLERFQREASSAGRLKHPNIVTIFDIGEADSLAFIAMEYLKGRPLSHFATAQTLLPAKLVLEIGADIADALDYAHRQNVIHRDIKPGNIMYDAVAGAATITDFGIARLIDVSRTRTGIVLGTPSFMAPEQLEGKNVNRHTDLFALGVTLYELLTGRLPFLGASMTNLMFVIANEPHTPVATLRPDLPSSLNAVFDLALAKSPDNRFASGADMAAALRQSASQAV